MGRKKAYSYDPNNKARGKGRRRGNISTDVDATELTGSVTWYAAPSIPEGHKVVVIDGHTMGRTTTGNATPQYIVLPTSSAELINVVNRIPGIGANATTEAGAYAALASSDACFVSSPDDASIVADGLVLELDASKKISYPGTGNTWYDLSGNGYNASKNGSPTYNSNGWWEFRNVNSDGDFEYFTLSFDEGVLKSGNTTGEWTLEALWRDMGSAYGNENIIIGRWGHHGGILQRTSGGYVYGQIRTNAGGTGQIFTGNTATTNEKWMHIVLTYNNRTARFYIDGKLVDTDSMSTSYTVYGHNNTMAIGGYPNNKYRAYADIAKVKAYNKELSQSEVKQNYYNGNIVTDGLVFAADAQNLVSYDRSGTITYSLTGSYSGSLVNGVTYNSNGWWDFDGTNDKIELSDTSYWKDNVFGNATNFTIMCWTKCDNFYNWSSMIHKDNGGYYSESEGASLWINSSGFQAVFGNGIPGNSGNWGNIISYSTSNTTDWFHLAFTGDGSTLKFYVNNVLVGSQGQSNRSAGKDITDNPVRIGVRANSAWYNGKIALPLFYTRSLTAEEVAQNFEAHRSRFGK